MVKMSVLHLLCVFLPVTLTAARLDISFFSLQATPSLSGSTFIGGYSAGTSRKTVGSKFQYGRVIDTGTGDDLPEGVTYRNVYGFARRLNLPSGASRPGVYYCEASAGGETERLQTVLVTKDAEIKPERQTVTVGWGDDVTLTMMTSLNEASLKLRYNGTEKPEWKGHYSIQRASCKV
ncbi:uncharacterized protein [Ptychodera flava]|uniref:uncharacterized protein n=1 Tax=Ptychodera flava TaxID=63121 RepID=UPI00396A79D0